MAIQKEYHKLALATASTVDSTLIYTRVSGSQWHPKHQMQAAISSRVVQKYSFSRTFQSKVSTLNGHIISYCVHKSVKYV